jgi:hypothetical protein
MGAMGMERGGMMAIDLPTLTDLYEELSHKHYVALERVEKLERALEAVCDATAGEWSDPDVARKVISGIVRKALETGPV